MILAAPTLAHGIFNAILFNMQIDESLCGFMINLFIIFFTKLRKRAKEKITYLIETR